MSFSSKTYVTQQQHLEWYNGGGSFLSFILWKRSAWLSHSSHW